MSKDICSVLQRQKIFFDSGLTRSYQFRVDALKRLETGIRKYEKDLYEALYKDLRKSHQETFLTEISIVLHEIRHHRKNLRKWMKMSRRPVPFYLVGSRCALLPEPYGQCLIIAPWNYPVQLLLDPLVGAISSGNCVALKSSSYTPNVTEVLIRLISEFFEEQHVAIFDGGRDVNMLLLEQRWDYIFFTGSPSLGRVVMQAAAKNVTPLTLELGGKSPCIVDQTVNLKMASKRITWGKFLNAGQTCVAPDYLLVHESVKERLIAHIAENVREFYGDNPQHSDYYGRIVNKKAFERLDGLLQDAQIISGGTRIEADLYIAPTIVDVPDPDKCKLMNEEIFGPILPVITFKDLSEVTAFVSSREKPLALYCFTDKSSFYHITKKTSSGAAVLNDVVVHVGNGLLPFGGVGNSGFGSYHGKQSFLTFSHLKPMLYSPEWYSNIFRFPPYKWFNLVKKMLS